MSTQALPTFDQVEEVLSQANAYLEASELHGLLCGTICHGQLRPDEEWLDVLLADTPEEIFAKVSTFILQMFKVSLTQLASLNFELQLLLPTDEGKSLLEQLSAVCHWCEGFLLGMEFGQRQNRRAYTDEVQEALTDIADISKSSLQAAKSQSVLDEGTLLEITEHVRVAVMLIFAELNGHQPSVKH